MLLAQCTRQKAITDVLLGYFSLRDSGTTSSILIVAVNPTSIFVKEVMNYVCMERIPAHIRGENILITLRLTRLRLMTRLKRDIKK